MVPPKIDIGGYMVYQNFRTIMNRNQTRDVYIYWQGVYENLKCDKSIEYQVVCSSNTDKDNNELVSKLILFNY